MSMELIEFMALARENGVALDLERVQKFTSIYNSLETVQDCCSALGEPFVSIFQSSDLATLANLTLSANKIPPVVNIIEALTYLLYEGTAKENGKALEYWKTVALFPRQKGVH